MAWLAVASLAQYGLSFLALIVLARLLTPAAFGVVALATVFLNLSKLFSEASMSAALIRRRDVRPAHVKVAFTLVLGLGVVAALLLVLAAHPLAVAFGAPELAPMLWVVAALAPVNAASAVAQALLSRRHAFRALALSELPGAVFGPVVLSIGLAVMGFGAWSLLLGMAVQQLLTAGMRLALAPDSARLGWERQAFNDLFTFGAAQTVVGWLNYVAMNADNLLVGKMMGVVSLGLYSRAFKLMMIPVEVVATAAQRVLFPTLSAMQDDLPRYRAAFEGGMAAMLAVLAPLSVVLVCMADPLVRLALGPGWASAAAVAQMLFGFLVFRCVGRQLSVPLMISGRRRTLIFIYLIYAAGVVLAAASGAAAGDLRLVALGVGCAQLAQYLLTSRTAAQLLQTRWRRLLSLHGPALATSAALALILVPVSMASAGLQSAWLQLGLTGLAAATVLPLLWLAAPRIFLGPEAAGLFAAIGRGAPSPVQGLLLRLAERAGQPFGRRLRSW